MALGVGDLRPVDLFDDLDDAALEPWAQAAEERSVAPGQLLSDQGDPAPGLLLLLAGTAQAQMVVDGRVEPVGRQVAPTWIGAIAALTGGPMGVRMQAESVCRVATVPTAAFVPLALATPAVHRRIMEQVAPVMGRLTAVEQNRERLASLGTMAAGLAHELNNPAAAAKRAAAQMAEALDVLASTLARFVESGLEREEAAKLLELQREALDHAARCTVFDVLDAADAEDALLERLEELGVAEPWRLTEPLAAAGLDVAWLDRVAAVTGPAAGAAIDYVAASLTARALADELRESTERMSGLVGAIKSYAYMDRGELVEVDVHEGLETTLVVLGHKLKHTEIEVVRDYDRSLPKLTARGSELNQVWTNLLDNAIDALGERGTITVRTRRDGPCILVEIADDGPGIPPTALARVFDPFFTTKEVGEGTGLGLDTARRIVVDRHDGSITVDSEPGSTTFHVWLPLSPPT